MKSKNGLMKEVLIDYGLSKEMEEGAKAGTMPLLVLKRREGGEKLCQEK